MYHMKVFLLAGVLAACGGQVAPERAKSFGPATLAWRVGDDCGQSGCSRHRSYVWSEEDGARLLADDWIAYFAADGEHAFVDRGEEGTWMIAVADGTECSLEAVPITVGFSPDGSLFVGESTDGAPLLVDAATCDVVLDTRDFARKLEVAWANPVSPDGAWAAYIERRAKYDANGIIDPTSTPDAVLLVDLENGATRQFPLAAGNRALSGAFVGWSPDSSRLLFWGVPGTGVHVMDLSGTVTELGQSHRNPRWLPSSLELAVVDRAGLVWIVDVATSERRELTVVDETPFVSVGDFSPEGERVAIQHADGDVDVRDTADGAIVARLSGVIDLGPGGWAVRGEQELIHLSQPDRVTLRLPVPAYSWVGDDRIAYVADGAVHLATFDGAEDEILWARDADAGSGEGFEIRFVGAR